MPEILTFSLVTFSAVFFVVNPFAVIPLFLSITRGDSLEKKKSTALRSSVAVAVTLFVFGAAGSQVLSLLGVTLSAFRIAGGILLFRIALDMVNAQKSRSRTSPEEEREGIEKDDVAIVPLAIPMLTGPGSMATAMVLSSEAWGSAAHMIAVAASFLATAVATYFLLGAATHLERMLGRTGLNIMSRVMGLVLAAMAVQFVVNGVFDLFPSLVSKG